MENTERIGKFPKMKGNLIPVEEAYFPNPKLMNVFWKSERTQAGKGYNPATNYRAVIDKNNDNVLAIVTDDYKLVKHEEAIDLMKKVISKVPDMGKPELLVWTSDDSHDRAGAKMRANFRFKDVIMKVGKDEINPTIDLYNSYDGKWSFSGIISAYRLICSNGLVIGKVIARIRKEHAIYFFKEKDIMDQIQSSIEILSEQTGTWKKWVDRVTTVGDVDTITKRLSLSDSEKKALYEEKEVSTSITIGDIEKVRTKSGDPMIDRMNYWVFYNIVCQFVTHKIKSEVRRARMHSIMRRVF